MIPRALFVYLGRVWFVLFMAFAFQVFCCNQGFCAEEPLADNGFSDSNDSVVFERKAAQLVTDLDYPDNVAKDFVKMIHYWKCDLLYQKLNQATQDVKQKKISWAQYAQIEGEIVNQLAQKIQREIVVADTSVPRNQRFFDLIFVIKGKRAQCLGLSQLFYILGNAIGLTVQCAQVEENVKGPMPPGTSHCDCLVGLHNGKALQVDLKLYKCVSKEFLFTKEYEKEGIYWKLGDKTNPLTLHPKIQLSDRNGLVAAIYSNRGALYIDLGQLDEAILILNKAVDLNPNHAETYCNLGSAYLRLKQPDKAVLEIDKALEINPKYAEAYNIRGNVYYASGKFPEAISDYKQAIKLKPKYIEAYGNMGFVYIYSGQPDKAVTETTKAIDRYPKNANLHLSRGFAYATLGKKEEAKNDLLTVIQLNPGLEDQVKKIADEFKLSL